jgi:hypothetical protein
MNLKNLKVWLPQYLNSKACPAHRPEDSTKTANDRGKGKPSISMVEILVRNPVQPT